MTLHPHDHILRFRFTSDSRDDIAHVVDLGGFDGFGECSCEDFQYRILPSLTRNDPTAGLKRCKHIIAAREHLADQVIARITAS
jgi:hypothetical protein